MIEVSELTKNYGPRAAIQGLNFKVAKGEIAGFLGPNGAGKTTTMKILTGFMPATSGKASVAGFDVFEKSFEVKKSIGYLPETPPLYLDMVVRDFMEFAANLKGIRGPAASKAVDSSIEKTGLGHVSKRIIGNLSKGYRQRVGLAQALVHDPPVLILDEPTVGLDPKQIIEIRELIKGLAGDHTVILSTHILPEVVATCQKLIIIKSGSIVAQDTIEGLSAQMNKGLHYKMIVSKTSDSGVKALEAVKGVLQVGKRGGDTLDIEIDSKGGEVRNQVIEAAQKNGMSVYEFSPKGMSLEDIYLRLIVEEEAHQ